MVVNKLLPPLLYAASALAIGFFVGSLNLPHYSRLEARGADAKARVTATDCNDHGAVAYAFQVADRTYIGRGNPGASAPRCDQLQPGDTISVRYLVADPSQSLPGDIDDRLRNEWLSVVVAAFGMPLIIVFVARRQLRRRGGARS
jgi:Protein of unknown function (DUF3592)